MLKILLPDANPNSGYQRVVGTILHVLVDGVRSVEEQLSNNTTLRYYGRQQFCCQYRNHVNKKYRVIRNYRIDWTLTNAAGLTAV